MYYYAVIEDENVIEMAEMPFPWGTPGEVTFAHPRAFVVEVSKDDYELVKGDMALFQYKNGKLSSKGKTERDAIIEHRYRFNKLNSLSEITKRLEALEKNNKITPNNI